MDELGPLRNCRDGERLLSIRCSTKYFSFIEVGGAESPIELMWGVGVVHWEKDGRVVDRPLLERRVDIELDDGRGGLIRVRPTSADAAV